MRNTMKDMSPEEIADVIAIAVKRAFHFFKPGQHTPDGPSAERLRFEAYCAARGHDRNLFDVSALSGVGYRHRTELAFGVGVEVAVEIEWSIHKNSVKATCNPSWGSCGTLDATTAVATATLHLEASQKACQAECAIEGALKGLRGSSDADAKAWFAGRGLYVSRLYDANKAIRDAYKAEHPEALKG